MEKKINRRKFIKKAAYTIAGVELAYLVYDVMQVKERSESDKGLFKAGKLTSFESNRMYPFTEGRFYLSVLEDGGLLAISIKCTHLGCMVEADAKGFQCPCHASSFNKYGEVLSPPATRALDIFPVKIKEGEVLVDTNRPIKRKKFDKSQLTYA